MKRWSLIVLLLMALGGKIVSGDVVSQTNSQGEEVILQRDAIVTHTDSAFVVYKHFDLKEHRVVVVRLNRGSLPLQVQQSDDAGRARIVKIWKQFGYKATVTDASGKTAPLFDVYLDFYPPGGRGSLLESIPALTNFPLMTENGGGDEIDFEKIARVDVQGETLTITRRDGKTETGKFLMPTSTPAEVRVLGITESYDPENPNPFDYSVPLSSLKSISFE